MATVWLSKIWNLTSKHRFTLRQDDGTWRPWIQERGVSVGRDEPIIVNPGEVLTCDHFFIPWIDWGRLRIEGPAGALEFSVGPTGPTTGDYLRGFDEARRELFTIPVGNRGSWWSSSVSFHLVFADDGLRWSIWSATNVGSDILGVAGRLVQVAAEELIEQLIGAAVP